MAGITSGLRIESENSKYVSSNYGGSTVIVIAIWSKASILLVDRAISDDKIFKNWIKEITSVLFSAFDQNVENYNKTTNFSGTQLSIILQGFFFYNLWSLILLFNIWNNQILSNIDKRYQLFLLFS